MAAEQGYAPAQYDLGICYRQGEGVDKDPLTAISWYLKAAEQGHGGAMNNLGIMYDNGIGVDVAREDLDADVFMPAARDKYRGRFPGLPSKGLADGTGTDIYLCALPRFYTYRRQN